MTVPQSCTTTYLRTSSAKRLADRPRRSWRATPAAVAPLGGPKYWVDSRPGSVPGRTAPRIGLAIERQFAERDRLAGHADDRRPCRRRSRGPPRRIRNARRRACRIFCRTAFAASLTAFPPPPRRGSRRCRRPSRTGRCRRSPHRRRRRRRRPGRRRSARSSVKWPCPWVPMPVATLTLPLACTWTLAPSYGPMPVPST